MTLDRRTLLAAAGFAALSGPTALARAAQALGTFDQALKLAQQHGDAAHAELMRVPGMHMHGSEQVALLLYPQFTALDLVGPYHFLAGMMGAQVHLVAKTREPVASDMGLAIVPTATFDDAPQKLDLLLIPGGDEGTIAAARDAATLDFVRSRAAQARYFGSVCTGTLVLGAAGLLRGRKATSHWAVRDLLADFGATPVDQRVVFDGPLVTGAGVSAGLDLGLALLGALRGQAFAEASQLIAEYAPAPIYHAGTPADTPPAIEKPVRGMFEALRLEARALAAGPS